MLPRFNELKLLAAAIRHRIGAFDNSSTWDCKTLGHFVPPDLISKKIKQRNFRFMTDCWTCKKHLLFDCAFNDNNDLVANCKEYSNPKDLVGYFNDINNNNYDSVDELNAHMPPHVDDHKLFIGSERNFSSSPCQVCGDTLSSLEMKSNLCQHHLLEALLHLKFRQRFTLDQIILDMKDAYENGGAIPSPVVQNKMIAVMKLMLSSLQGKELTDFFLVLPAIIQKLEAVAHNKRSQHNN